MTTSRRILLPETPAIATGLSGAAWLDPTGEIEELTFEAAARRITEGARPILCHAPATARRLSLRRLAAYDVLELFAFVRPLDFCVPTPRGLGEALGIEMGHRPTEASFGLVRAAQALLQILSRSDDRDARSVAWAMAQGGWAWGPSVLAALGEEPEGDPSRSPGAGLDVWRRLPEWSEHAPPPPAASFAVEPEEARSRLNQLLDERSEPRPSQADYASATAGAFRPRNAAGAPNFVLAEAGTGVGKTLGYIAPASVWAEKNEAPVWLSTYTRNLQHQIDQELDRLYPEPALKMRRVVVRKGRENYLCLLNLEEAVRGVGVRREDAVGLGLMARWAARTRDGDLTGGDFPSWLVDLLGAAKTLDLSDHHGECIYSACQHYQKCYIERGVRRARRADLVIANHALVMVQAVRGKLDSNNRPTRFVFDEGHHVFDAADSAFSALLSGREAAELRRWLRGAEARGSGRARGLRRRIEDLLAGDEDTAALDDILRSAGTLPGEGWRQRVSGGEPRGSAETFLAAVRSQVYARATGVDGPYDLECDIGELVPGLLDSAAALAENLGRLARPLKALRESLIARLDDEAETLETATRLRIESMVRSLQNRGEDVVAAWRSMLESLASETPERFVDWFSVQRFGGRDIDVGMHRHWLDPTVPFAEHVAAPAHGVVVTSATLRDGTGDPEADWAAAEIRTGAAHLPAPAVRAAVPSPFDYAEMTRVLVVNDVRKDDLGQVAAAYRELFLASGGGALGLFTAISRLRAVHGRLVAPLDQAGLPLFAQHVDGLNLPTLIDIFRAEEDACLLGTDAVRDGVDVPGPSLRLIVFDRVPWPRPTILHRARRKAFGGRSYDDMLTRLRLKQAYGRMVRRAGDRGVFVMLDPMMPSRLSGAFPEGVEIERIGLADAVHTLRDFFAKTSDAA
jgi:ATP-dependent DNA helicase DinG